MTIKCECGCGQDIPAIDARGRPRRFANNHHFTGIKHSAEWLAAQASGSKAAWSDPTKFTTMRQQSPELVEKRVAPLRGRKMSPERCAQISKALTGLKQSEEHRQKTVKNLVRYPQLSDEAKARRILKISIGRTGTHGCGRAARDRLDHFNAKHWIIRSPLGTIYECDNLQAWARKNESLFMPDDFPLSRLPLWRRAVGGFNNMRRRDRKACCSWRGWTLVGVEELKTMGAPDMLGRI